jgi:hypothetical protein
MEGTRYFTGNPLYRRINYWHEAGENGCHEST